MQATGRVIKLDDGAAGRLVRFVSDSVRLGEGQPSSWVTVTRTGEFTDPRYGNFSITREMLDQMVRNFSERVYGQDVFIDVAHQPTNGAAGKVVALQVDGDRLRAKVEWTPMGVDAVLTRGFQYLSAEYHENWRDNEGGAPHGCVLLGAGLVTRPCIKRLDPVVLGEAGGGGDPATVLHPKLLDNLLKELSEMKTKYMEALRKKCGELKLSSGVTDSLVTALGAAMDGMGDDEKKCGELLASFEGSAVKLAEQGGAVNVTVTGLSADDVNKAVIKALAERDAQARQAADTLAGRQRFLAEQIESLGKGLPEALRVELVEELKPAITAEMTDAGIASLAGVQVKLCERAEAAKQLSAKGFSFRGNAHITVDDSNTVKALQESIDKRLGLTPAKDSPNQAFVEKVLAAFDAERGNDLRREHKMLAGGDGLVSDVSVPSIFERTVIREALHPLVSLQFVNVGTLQFAVAAQIPYSYRDTAGASRDSTRKYEGQAIARAGIKQALDTAYPIPQKLAFEVSDELRYLTGSNIIDFDATAENVRNAARIIGEDTERMILNEIVNSSDEFAVTTVTSENLGASVNGTNKTFALANFPVVKPRKVYDLQGTQVGSTVNPIVVTLNSVARTEYDGTGTQASGTYWTLDYNLGELRFVSELGASVTPTNAWPLTVTYGYSTNCYKFDTDLGSDSVGVKWDDFLYRYGLRRAVIEDSRYYRANFGLMAGSVHEQVLRANQFSALYDRGGATVTAAGDLGNIRGVPNFKSFAPALQLADTRVLIGERGNTRYRMMKPWQMGELQDQRDSNGRFTGKKEAYGDQFVVLHTPTSLKGCYTSVILYSGAGRVTRTT